MQIYIVHFKSDSCDHYCTAFKEKPSSEAISKWIEDECFDEDIDTGELSVKKVELK